MKNKIAHTNSTILYRICSTGWYCFACILLCFLMPYTSFANKEEDEAADEEISISIELSGLGMEDIPAIYHNKELYLSVNYVFDFLKIKNNPTNSFDTVSGFFLNQKDLFLIDKTHDRIKYKDKTFELQKSDLINTGTSLYLNIKYYKSVFGLDATFNFRSLLVKLNTSLELPAIREMKEALMRKNMNRIRGEMKADTTIKRTYPLFHFNALDWSATSIQQSLGGDETRLNLGIGAVIAGGETNVSLNYYSTQKFDEKLQFYQWRYVNNESDILKQVAIGKIFPQATSSLYAPVVGVQLTNTPTTNRRSYGRYTLSDVTEPGWIVELYLNEVLVDYKKSDASGFYSFEVPLIYGLTIVRLRFYGPFGEEKTSQQLISIPFNFVPAHQLEYAVSAGIVEDQLNSRFSRTSFNYGLTNRITVGGGMEYLSSVTSGNTMPFINAAFRIASSLLLSGEYMYGVRSKAILNYRLPLRMQLEIDYTTYEKGQTAIYYNYLEERKAVLTMPIFKKGASIFTKFSCDQIVLPDTKYTNLEFAVIANYHGVGINYTTYSSITGIYNPYAYSIIGLSFQLPKKVLFTSEFQYDYKRNNIDFMKYTFERYMRGKGYMNVSYQRYFNSNNQNLLMGIRYDFSVARVSVSSLIGNNNLYSRVESASGSLVFDKNGKYFNANYRSNVGKGGIVVRPFLDLNCNGIFDEGEPKAFGLKFHVNGGRMIYDNKDTSIRVFELEPYTNYYVELDVNSFDNIAWQMRKHTIQVTTNSNNFTEVDIPIAVVGTISGVVSIKSKDGKELNGQGQILINIYKDDMTLAAKTMTEPDGFFSYLGLAPGSYKVMVDTTQLHKLGLVATPESFPVSFSKNIDGSEADGLEFTLESTRKHQQTADTAKKLIADKGSYIIEVGAFCNINNAIATKTKIANAFNRKVAIVQIRQYYRVRVTGFNNYIDALKFKQKLAPIGFKNPKVMKLDEAIFE